MPEIFDSAVFIGYSHTLFFQMAEQYHKMMWELIFLSGGLSKLDDQLKATKEILTEGTKGAAENRVLKDEIKW